jgi:hypothetical protein
MKTILKMTVYTSGKMLLVYSVILEKMSIGIAIFISYWLKELHGLGTANSF